MKRTLFVLMLLLSLLLCSATALAAEPALTVSGDGVEQELSFSAEELAALPQVQALYTAINTFPTQKQVYAEGVDVLALLAQAGLKDEAALVTVIAADGYKKSFTAAELQQKRYAFIDKTPAETPVLLALRSSEKSFDELSDCQPKLVLGQRVANEQNNPWFVDGVAKIEVSTAAPAKWLAPVCKEEAVEGGILFTPHMVDLNNVKIYYTVDGSDPNLNSSMFNISAPRFQPELNESILVTEDTTIKLIAIGAGRPDSDITTIKVSLTAQPFADLAGYNWARIAIESLSAAKIVNGMNAENTLFAPEGELTRAQMAKMLVLALGKEPLAAEKATFNDVAADHWGYGYIEQAAALGLIDGYSDGSFAPNKPVSREEMVKMTACAFSADVPESSSSQALFLEKSGISEWAEKYFWFGWEQWLLPYGYTVKADTTQNLLWAEDAKAPACRAEAAVAVYNLVNALSASNK